jgi:hypothetical protein
VKASAIWLVWVSGFFAMVSAVDDGIFFSAFTKFWLVQFSFPGGVVHNSLPLEGNLQCDCPAHGGIACGRNKYSDVYLPFSA